MAPARQLFEGIGAVIAKDPDVAPQQQGITGGQERGSSGHGLRAAHLGLTDAQEGSFIAEIDFDFPASQVGGDEFGRRSGQVGGDQEGWLPIPELAALAQAITGGELLDGGLLLRGAAFGDFWGGGRREAHWQGAPRVFGASGLDEQRSLHEALAQDQVDLEGRAQGVAGAGCFGVLALRISLALRYFFDFSMAVR